MRHYKSLIKSVLFHGICILLCGVSIYPVIWLVKSSLTESSQVFIQSAKLIPDKWFFVNYINGWKGFGRYSFGVFFRNTTFLTVVGTFGLLLSSSLIAYGLSRIHFRGRKLLFASMITSMMLPYQVTMIPEYIMFYNVGWANTFLPLLIPSFLGSPFHIFLMMQFIKTIPRQIDEAAVIDGCNSFSLYSKIILPLLTPALVTAGIFAFFGKWNDFMGPLLYLSKVDTYTLSLALRMFADPEALTDWGAMFAMQFLSLIPCLLVFFIFQKKIVEGISTTGLKG